MRIIVSICIMLCTSLLTKAQNKILILDDLDHEIAMSPPAMIRSLKTTSVA